METPGELFWLSLRDVLGQLELWCYSCNRPVTVQHANRDYSVGYSDNPGLLCKGCSKHTPYNRGGGVAPALVYVIAEGPHEGHKFLISLSNSISGGMVDIVHIRKDTHDATSCRETIRPGNGYGGIHCNCRTYTGEGETIQLILLREYRRRRAATDSPPLPFETATVSLEP